MTIEKRKYNILIIEDNEGDYTLVEEFLYEQFNTLNIVHVNSYRSASEVLNSIKSTFDVILLDLSLPDMTGEELIMKIIGMSSNVPVIVLTGYSDNAFGIKSLSLGVSDYILKDELTSLSLYKSILYSLERKKITTALEESERRYSDLFRLSPWPMWVYNIDTLRFLNVNEAAIKQYGYSKEEFLSMTLADIRPEEDWVKLEEAASVGKQIRDLFLPGIFNHRKKNGEVIQVDIQSNFIQYNGQKAKVILANNVTERLNYVKAIETQNNKLKEIAWVQSHIVRAPLARIMALTELIKTTKDDDPEKEMMMEFIQLSAQELDEVIRDITDKTKIDLPPSVIY